jgi:hypothetical protein
LLSFGLRCRAVKYDRQIFFQNSGGHLPDYVVTLLSGTEKSLPQENLKTHFVVVVVVDVVIIVIIIIIIISSSSSSTNFSYCIDESSVLQRYAATLQTGPGSLQLLSLPTNDDVWNSQLQNCI